MLNFTKILPLCRNFQKNFLRSSNYGYRNYCAATRALKINDVSIEKYLDYLRDEYNTLLYSSLPNATENRRFKELQPILKAIERRNHLIENISNLQDLFDDKDADIQKLAVEEKQSFENQLELVDEKLKDLILPVDEEDECDAIILEVNAGVGGQEAMLFAKELFDMYCNFAEYKNWELKVSEFQKTDLGGIRQGSALISGDGVFRFLKHEAGVHRVQRIPTTEKSGRVHTSTVSVLAFPQPKNIEINLHRRDLNITNKNASGAGGQHVNNTNSAVRITHVPTNISVECQVGRMQFKNKAIALQKIETLMYEQELQAQMSDIKNTKKKQVKSNNRNEKIRTYNFSQDRIKDHRLPGHNIHNMNDFLKGSKQLENLILSLHRLDKFNSLLDVIKKNVDINK